MSAVPTLEIDEDTTKEELRHVENLREEGFVTVVQHCDDQLAIERVTVELTPRGIDLVGSLCQMEDRHALRYFNEYMRRFEDEIPDGVRRIVACAEAMSEHFDVHLLRVLDRNRDKLSFDLGEIDDDLLDRFD